MTNCATRGVRVDGQAAPAVAHGPQPFRVRLDARADQIRDILERPLDAGVRVEATLPGLYPDLPRTARKAIP